MKTIALTPDMERKLELILSIVVLDNYLLAQRSNISMPQMGKDAMELQALLGTPSVFKAAA